MGLADTLVEYVCKNLQGSQADVCLHMVILSLFRYMNLLHQCILFCQSSDLYHQALYKIISTITQTQCWELSTDCQLQSRLIVKTVENIGWQTCTKGVHRHWRVRYRIRISLFPQRFRLTSWPVFVIGVFFHVHRP